MAENSSKPVLLVVDGHSLAFRAFYALPPDSFQTTSGQYTNAINGFLSMLINLIQQEKPSHIAIAFDVGRESFRNEIYPDYKATRSETPEEFKGQVPLLKETLEALSMTVIEAPGYEADDVLATLSKQGSDAGWQVLLVSGDRDTIQLIDQNTTLLYPVKGVSTLIRYDDEQVYEKYGVYPKNYPDIAALVGETSDNIIGVPGVGPKTAAKWLSEYPSLEQIFANTDKLRGKVVEQLIAMEDQIKLNRTINTLVRDLDLPFKLSDYERQEVDPERLRESFAKLEFRSLLERAKKILLTPESREALEQPHSEASPLLEIPALPELLAPADALKWLESTTDCSLWLEDAWDSNDPIIAAADARGRIEVPLSAVKSQLVTMLASSTVKLRVYDLKTLVKALGEVPSSAAAVSVDATLAAWLLDSGNGSKDFAILVEEYLGETLSVPPADQLVPEEEGSSASEKAWYLFRLCEVLLTKLDDKSQEVLSSIELPLAPVLAGLELVGIAVDSAKLGTLHQTLSERLTGIEKDAYAAIGKEINLNSPKQLQEVLFVDLGLKPTKSTKTGYSTDAESIADLSITSKHPFLQLLLDYRDSNKLKQITETLQKSVKSDGRIHTTYQQNGTTTGRLSSNDPNLQNIPVKTQEGRQLRAAFVATEGFSRLLTADYSQIEMRIMAHLSGDPGLIEAFNLGEDLHRFVGARVFGVAPESVTPSMRSKVKAMSYGLVYGLSAFGLSRQLRVEVSEARQLMTDYFARFGAVRTYLREVVEQARIDGFTETIFGRRRYFPDLASSNRIRKEAAERAALNAPIQGTAADIIKIAMMRIADEMREQKLSSRMLLQVHDELVFEVHPGEEERLEVLVTTIMGNAATLSVPLDVQIGRGANWDEAGH